MALAAMIGAETGEITDREMPAGQRRWEETQHPPTTAARTRAQTPNRCITKWGAGRALQGEWEIAPRRLQRSVSEQDPNRRIC